MVKPSVSPVARASSRHSGLLVNHVSRRESPATATLRVMHVLLVTVLILHAPGVFHALMEKYPPTVKSVTTARKD